MQSAGHEVCMLSLAGLLQIHNWYHRPSRFGVDVGVSARSGWTKPGSEVKNEGGTISNCRSELSSLSSRTLASDR